MTATAQTGQTVDDAVRTINAKLQQSNDSTLKQVFAVKEVTTDTVESHREHQVPEQRVGIPGSSLGSTPGGGGFALPSTDSANVDTAATLGTGGSADISNQASAQSAVTALSSAVTNLGSAQAVVGRGQNQLTYAVNLAQSQLSNEAAAESRT